MSALPHSVRQRCATRYAHDSQRPSAVVSDPMTTRAVHCGPLPTAAQARPPARPPVRPPSSRTHYPAVVAPSTNISSTQQHPAAPSSSTWSASISRESSCRGCRPGGSRPATPSRRERGRGSGGHQRQPPKQQVRCTSAAVRCGCAVRLRGRARGCPSVLDSGRVAQRGAVRCSARSEPSGLASWPAGRQLQHDSLSLSRWRAVRGMRTATRTAHGPGPLGPAGRALGLAIRRGCDNPSPRLTANPCSQHALPPARCARSLAAPSPPPPHTQAGYGSPARAFPPARASPPSHPCT